MKTRTVAYLRVSTEKQADKGVSLDAQRAKAAAYAELYDLELVEIVVDAGASAKTLEREGLQRALGLLRTGRAEALLVVKLDRLTRSVRDLGHLVEKYFATGRWALLSVGEQVDTRTAAGRLVLNVLASVAQWEREATGERTSAALQHKAAAGEYTGGAAPYGYRVAGAGGAAPYGYRVAGDGVRLEPAPEEQAVVAHVRAERAAGRSLRVIAAGLAERGVVSRGGRPFGIGQIHQFLASERSARAPAQNRGH